ncbi:hypothetical protein C8R43DRAFT_1241231 [Mycena crocata]|nr:hypothetical protein C8R43DRAFT_1241231 [Mycena crocata]
MLFLCPINPYAPCWALIGLSAILDYPSCSFWDWEASPQPSDACLVPLKGVNATLSALVPEYSGFLVEEAAYESLDLIPRPAASLDLSPPRRRRALLLESERSQYYCFGQYIILASPPAHVKSCFAENVVAGGGNLFPVRVALRGYVTKCPCESEATGSGITIISVPMRKQGCRERYDDNLICCRVPMRKQGCRERYNNYLIPDTGCRERWNIKLMPETGRRDRHNNLSLP